MASKLISILFGWQQMQKSFFSHFITYIWGKNKNPFLSVFDKTEFLFVLFLAKTVHTLFIGLYSDLPTE